MYLSLSLSPFFPLLSISLSPSPSPSPLLLETRNILREIFSLQIFLVEKNNRNNVKTETVKGRRTGRRGIFEKLAGRSRGNWIKKVCPSQASANLLPPRVDNSLANVPGSEQPGKDVSRCGYNATLH